MKGAIGTLVVFYLLQGCLANIIFTALNIENHPCRPENLKVCTYILFHYAYLKISGLANTGPVNSGRIRFQSENRTFNGRPGDWEHTMFSYPFRLNF